MIKAIIFDFDGTIVNSHSLLTQTLKKTIFKDFNIVLTEEQIRPYYGMNGIGILRGILKSKYQKSVFNDYYMIYQEIHDQHTPALDLTLIEILEFLKEKKIPLFILTGRDSKTLNYSLNKFHINKYFKKKYYGSSTFKNKSFNFTKLLKEQNLKNDEVIYIGDSVGDIKACNSVNIKIISVAYYRDEDMRKLENYNDIVCNSFDDLKNTLINLFDL
ncbi:MAG: HAD-IA family hydrolase [Erysipelotrichales bacterium]|nr:HAD-IA family hydrolase [Erysipelotrichales bacterium]